MGVNIRHSFRGRWVLRLAIQFVGYQVLLWHDLGNLLHRWLSIVLGSLSVLICWSSAYARDVCERWNLVYLFDLVLVVHHIHGSGATDDRAILGIRIF